MSSLVVGSIALDTVETPFGRVENALGGTAVFFSLAASLFTDVMLVGVIGDDFPVDGIELLQQHGVDLSGLQRDHGLTFHWAGEYAGDMNVARTLDTRLNVFESFHPTIPDHYRDARFVFLGNIAPELQLEVLEQIRTPVLTVLDTMNFWIERRKEALTEALCRVDVVLINEAEICQYSGHDSALEAAHAVIALGPKYVVVKRGEYGATLFTPDDVFAVPAYPTQTVRDTTGAGDSFAGGFMGYLDLCDQLDTAAFRAAVTVGTVVASHTVEDFSVHGLLEARRETILERCARLAKATRIDVNLPPRWPEQLASDLQSPLAALAS